MGLDKFYVDKLVTEKGEKAVSQALANKKMSIIFNRCQKTKEIPQCLDQLREYLETLDKYDKYKDRIHLVGLLPQHKIINITNNRGVLFYAKDEDLSCKMDLIAYNIVTKSQDCPTLKNSNQDILSYLQKYGRPGMVGKLGRLAGKLQANVSYGREKPERSFTRGLSIPFLWPRKT